MRMKLPLLLKTLGLHVVEQQKVEVRNTIDHTIRASHQFQCSMDLWSLPFGSTVYLRWSKDGTSGGSFKELVQNIPPYILQQTHRGLGFHVLYSINISTSISNSMPLIPWFWELRVISRDLQWRLLIQCTKLPVSTFLHTKWPPGPQLVPP